MVYVRNAKCQYRLEGDKMIIVYDLQNNKVIENMGTNNNFPSGNIPMLPELPEGKVYLKLHDKSDDAKLIQSAKEYELIVEDNKLVNVNVLKTHKQDKQEKLPCFTILLCYLF